MQYRAQRLKDTWKKRNWGTIPLTSFIEYQYKQYLKLCNRCQEKPVSFGKWLCYKS